MSKKYYTLLGRCVDETPGCYEILFGDYNRAVVENEASEYKEHPGNSSVRQDLIIITTSDAQEDINARVNLMNSKIHT